VIHIKAIEKTFSPPEVFFFFITLGPEMSDAKVYEP